MVIKGKDAKRFLEAMQNAHLTPERHAWLTECGRQSKEAEARGRTRCHTDHYQTKSKPYKEH